MAVFQGPWHAAAEQHLIDARVHRTAPKAPLEGRANVAGGIKLLPRPALFEAVAKVRQFVSAAPGAQRLGRYLGRHHAGFHGGMRALDLGHVQGSGLAADQRAAGEGQFGQALQPLP